jgi:hypothetical protein
VVGCKEAQGERCVRPVKRGAHGSEPAEVLGRVRVCSRVDRGCRVRVQAG